MKLQDFLIGIGVFAVFTIIIFGAISNDGTDCEGIYCQNYLNITHDAITQNAIGNMSNEGAKSSGDFDSLRGGVENFTGGEDPTESSLVGSSLKVLINIPSSFTTVGRVLNTISAQLNIPTVFVGWALGSIVIIIILIIIAAFVKNPFKS